MVAEVYGALIFCDGFAGRATFDYLEIDAAYYLLESFCALYHSCKVGSLAISLLHVYSLEREANENVNGLISQFFLKKLLKAPLRPLIAAREGSLITKAKTWNSSVFLKIF